MTVKELKYLMNDLPDHLEVMIEKTDQEFNLSLLISAEIKECTFSDGKLKAKDNCLVLSD
jgi:hypothetical protein